MNLQTLKNISKQYFQVKFDHTETYEKFDIDCNNGSTPEEKIQDGHHHNLTSPYMDYMTLWNSEKHQQSSITG